MFFLNADKAAEFRRSTVRDGDLVFTCWGTIGQVGLVDKRSKFREYVISNKQMKLTPDPAKADSLFLYYALSGPELMEVVRSQAIGSSVPGFNLGQLRSLKLRLPPLDEQRAIARVLGALDDKIELNRQMNETLEGMARALFKSWFVDFDPVRARAERHRPAGMDGETAKLFPSSFVESELGKIPKGWIVRTLGDVAGNPRRGVDPIALAAGTPYIGLEHMPRKSIALGEWGQSDSIGSNKFRFAQGEILFGKLRPYFHKVGVAVTDGVCSTDILVIVAKEPQWFAFVLAHVSSDELIQHADATSTGTKMPRTNWQDLARFQVVTPSDAVACAFDGRVRPMTEVIRANIHQSRSLAALRDTLLPKLLSGEIRVKDAEKFVGART